ncbi:MAG: hypothetical protein KDI71_18860 [Xanthomonadales bacterium]|nr:hypothetical protein [Xanthomonadales bacterium]
MTKTFPTPRLSKSKIISGRQCERRIWLEVYRPELRRFNPIQRARLQRGTDFGVLARALLGGGELVDFGHDHRSAISRTSELLGSANPPEHIFEAAITHQNVIVRVDALRTIGNEFDLIEVKSSTEVKEYFIEDCAIQTWVARGAGLPIRRVMLGLLNPNVGISDWSRSGESLRLQDVTDQVSERLAKVHVWVRRFESVLHSPEPSIIPGPQCIVPFGCPFVHRCGPTRLPPACESTERRSHPDTSAEDSSTPSAC